MDKFVCLHTAVGKSKRRVIIFYWSVIRHNPRKDYFFHWISYLCMSSIWM